MKHADGRATLLRRVDGVPHVVIGPLLLAAPTVLERSTGVSRTTLTTFLVAFTAYGVVVVVATDDLHAPPPPWLVPLGATANVAAVAVGSLAMARRDLTRPGRLAGAGLAAGGVRMLLALRKPPAQPGGRATSSP